MFVSSFQVQNTEFKEARNEEGVLFCFGLQFTDGDVMAVGTLGGHTVVSTVKKHRSMIIGAHHSLFDTVL